MTLLLAAILISGVAGLVVILPILTRRAARLRDVTAGHVQDADARKRVVLNELRELEYEFLGGKLDEADYLALRETITAEAVVAIRASDALHDIGERAPARGSSAALAEGSTADASSAEAHACGFLNPGGSRFCAGCGARLL